MTGRINHKKGDTFDWVGPIVLTDIDENQITDFTGWSGRASVRSKKNGEVFDFALSWESRSPAVIRLRAEADYNDTWPIGHYDMDAQLITPNGDVISTPNVLFVQSQDVTQ